MSASALHSHLQLLEVERMYASLHLADDDHYMADLLDEIASARAAYVTQAITEIATLRGALWGPQLG
jgi:hypothetical protein